MRSHVPSYDVVAARTLGDVLDRLATEPGIWRPFAGGTDLMVLFEAGQLAHRKFVNLWGIKELGGIKESKDSVAIGALTTYAEIERNKTLAREFPMLGMAARETGAIAIQNRGTIGGNIANASPAADTPPALLAYDAEIELVSKSGKRRVPYSEFHTGYKKTVLRSDELIYRIHLKRNTRGLVQEYRKVGTRKAQAISKVCFAATLRLEKKGITTARLAFGSIAATPVRCKRTETLLVGNALDAALIARARASLESEITPIDDIRSTAEYRKHVAGALLERFLTQLQPKSERGKPRKVTTKR